MKASSSWEQLYSHIESVNAHPWAPCTNKVFRIKAPLYIYLLHPPHRVRWCADEPEYVAAALKRRGRSSMHCACLEHLIPNKTQLIFRLRWNIDLLLFPSQAACNDKMQNSYSKMKHIEEGNGTCVYFFASVLVGQLFVSVCIQGHELKQSSLSALLLWIQPSEPTEQGCCCACISSSELTAF